ncbi:hypothetical protein ASG69_19255 [Rhodococcus sp. Leaf225]|nr:hypothetical protein ASG69_19255 [Rhodococcus sp. Leaf225]KQU48923.1 hypothetical protein ASH03_03720 [Rhodococcus sp. Leaf258]
MATLTGGVVGRSRVAASVRRELVNVHVGGRRSIDPLPGSRLACPSSRRGLPGARRSAVDDPVGGRSIRANLKSRLTVETRHADRSGSRRAEQRRCTVRAGRVSLERTTARFPRRRVFGPILPDL